MMTTAKLYDQCRVQYQCIERYREDAKRKTPALRSELVLRRLVLERFEREYPERFNAMRKLVLVPQREPRRWSPTERMKSVTSILDPYGEMTGGNFGARF